MRCSSTIFLAFCQEADLGTWHTMRKPKQTQPSHWIKEIKTSSQGVWSSWNLQDRTPKKKQLETQFLRSLKRTLRRVNLICKRFNCLPKNTWYSLWKTIFSNTQQNSQGLTQWKMKRLYMQSSIRLWPITGRKLVHKNISKNVRWQN